MTEPIRVLHVFGRTGRGGAESRIMDIYRLLDRSLVQFDFLVHADAAPTGKKVPGSEELMAHRAPDDLDEEILSLGGHIYALPRLSMSFSGTGIGAYRKACERFFSEHRDIWQVVQGHMTSTAAIYLPAAVRGGVPVTIAHARSAGTDPGLKGLLTRFLRLPLGRETWRIRGADGRKRPVIDHRFACSADAAKSVFRSASVRILPNAVLPEDFRFDPGARSEIREALKLGKCRVIGHVGSFRYAKNHEFLLRVFRKLLDRSGDPGLRLMLLGSGELYEEMQALAVRLGIREYVLFLGNRQGIADYYQAMDVFAFPSRYEGLPGSVIEAQASGLPCLISDTVTPEVDATELVSREGIGETGEDPGAAADRWAERLRELLGKTPPGERMSRSETACRQLAEEGFDARGQAALLEKFYLTGAFS